LFQTGRQLPPAQPKAVLEQPSSGRIARQALRRRNIALLQGSELNHPQRTQDSVIHVAAILKKVRLDMTAHARYCPAASAFGGRSAHIESGETVMARLLLGVVAMVAGLSGCAAPPRYVSKASETAPGVVAIPDDTDDFPSYNLRSAKELIVKDVGPNYEIVEQKLVTVQRPNVRNQHAQTERVRQPGQINPFTNEPPATDGPSTHEVSEWQITYRRTNGPTNAGDGSIQQTQYRSGSTPNAVYQAGGINDIVPSCAPGGGVVPAGGCPGGCPTGKCNIR